jgi:hypothetical protein
MANVKFNSAGQAIAKNDLDTVSFKVMFCDPAYTPDPDTEVYLLDVSANRATGTTDLATTLTISVDNTLNVTKFDFSDIVTGTITASTNAIVLYIDTGVEATSELITYNELVDGADTPTTFNVVGGVLTATVDADGIFTI